MRIVKYTSILSTLILIVLVGMTNYALATSMDMPFNGEQSSDIDAIIADNDDEHFTSEDIEYLNEFEIYMASKEFYDIQKHVILAGAKVHIKVYRKSQSMTVYVGGKKKYSWKTTTGSRARYGKSAVTPAGTHKPYAMTKSHRHSSGKYRLPYSIKVKGGYFIHGTKATHMLGKKLSRTVGSHGCMRLSMQNARTLYSLVSKYGLKNTTVTVY